MENTSFIPTELLIRKDDSKRSGLKTDSSFNDMGADEYDD
jgi:hypothetical protein